MQQVITGELLPSAAVPPDQYLVNLEISASFSSAFLITTHPVPSASIMSPFAKCQLSTMRYSATLGPG